jgi:hypothetical protein
MDKTSTVELLVSTNNLNPEDIPTFELGVKMTNHESKSIPFDLSDSSLYVNSERNIAWDLTVNNGTLMNITISPGKSETIFWPIGEALFNLPGIYELKLVRETDIQRQMICIAEVLPE